VVGPGFLDQEGLRELAVSLGMTFERTLLCQKSVDHVVLRRPACPARPVYSAGRFG
jgi:hypothetical protein